ncbi:Rha family transcriptional regulator [Fructobacillus fructosus]|uniref:Rha family transcriptional regulator n=1 Tax=Fructobacillus fructosus TaxID=1631 RepID=UPI0016589FA0|nr:Rha family transcriptional regulator [Fructobacillus fructosus]MBC9118634.1 Rha family transcriptional regulator [Fructobacillus fructosus]MBD9365297.1 Rha family transcriptional regulator [Leuconostoc mesenteroides]
MEELVFFKGIGSKAKLYTTTEVIAEYTGIKYKSVYESVRNNQDDLKELGVLPFEMVVPQKGTLGGQPKKVYQLNEQQATLLITYLRNTPQVKEFKKALVKAFYSMKQELDQSKLNRELNKRANIELAETIKAEFPDDPHAYSNYHQLAYKCATGMTPKQLKKAKGVNSPEEALDNDQKERLERAKQHIALYLLDGNDYQDIKKKLLADI